MLATIMRSSFLTVLVAVLVFPFLTPQEANAQDGDVDWRQTVEVITPVEDNQVTGALLDSLVTLLERENLQVKREPSDENLRTFQELEDALLSDGVDFYSANQLFISYRFEANRRGLQTTIDELYFIYRPAGGEEMDIPIFSVDATDPAIKDLLRNSGMQIRTNEVAFRPFHDQLLFHNLEESTLVALGGEIIRDPEQQESERQRVLRTVQSFLY